MEHLREAGVLVVDVHREVLSPQIHTQDGFFTERCDLVYLENNDANSCGKNSRDEVRQQSLIQVLSAAHSSGITACRLNSFCVCFSSHFILRK